VLDRFVHSGYIDGFTIADNIKNDASGVQLSAWRTARERWPAPFLLVSTCSQVSFPQERYDQGAAAARQLVAAYVEAPLQGGADGTALWAWHQMYDGALYTILDKDGGENALWQQLKAVTHGL
jgi:hypothetical protein